MPTRFSIPLLATSLAVLADAHATAQRAGPRDPVTDAFELIN